MGAVWDATAVTSFQTSAAVLGGLLDRRLAALGAGAAQHALARRAVRARRIPARPGCAPASCTSTRSSGLVTRPRDGRADRDPVPRRPRGRRRSCCSATGSCRCASWRSRCRSPLSSWRCSRTRWSGSAGPSRFLLGALLSPTDPVLSSGVVTDPARPAGDPSLAQPRVGAQRRPGAACRAGLRSGARSRQRAFRVVALRAAGRRARVRLRPCLRADRLAADGPRAHAPTSAVRSRAIRRLSTVSASPSPPTGLPPCRRTATASSRCSSQRSWSAFAAPIYASALPCTPRRSWRSSSSAIFAVFGSLLTIHGLFADGWAAVGVVVATFLLARPFAVWLALAGTRAERRREGLHGVVRS